MSYGDKFSVAETQLNGKWLIRIERFATFLEVKGALQGQSHSSIHTDGGTAT